MGQGSARVGGCQDDLTDAEVSEAKKALDEARYEVEEC